MYNDIIEYLNKRRLKEALTQLMALVHEIDNWQLQSEVEDIQTTYNYMLQYAEQGMEDPERGKLYHKLRRTTYELADRAEFIRKHRSGTGHLGGKVYSLKQIPPHSFQELCLGLETFNEDIAMIQISIMDEEQRKAKLKELYDRHEQNITELFDKIWTSVHWTEEEQAGANSILTSLLIQPNDIAVMVSAVTLSLLQLFDSRKFQFLLNTYQQHQDPMVTQRALLGVALTVYYHEKRIKLYPELLGALSILADSTPAISELNNIQTILLLSRETEKINRKMRDEIIPNMKISSELLSSNIKITDLEDLEDKNPEWEKEISRVQDHIRELGELQLEGADTYMGSFAQLKGYPFFRQAAHWFYPFDRHQPEVASLFDQLNSEKKSFIDILMESNMFCNSDKYSFCLAIKDLPSNQLEFLHTDIAQMGDAIKESGEAISNETKNEQRTLAASRQYIQDLYRFFKLWMYHGELHDIFNDDLALWKCKTLAPLTHSPENLKHIADHLFVKDYFEEASEIYNNALEKNADIWQKTGFCYQKMKQYSKALEAYNQADLMKPDHIWTLKHMAQCYKRLNQYKEALDCLYKVEAMQPENLNLLLQIGQCLATLHIYDKALAYFFKVEYLDKVPANAQRAIGWCYFMTGKYNEAIRFFEKVQQTDKVQVSDWLNAGHVYLVQNNIQKALQYYRKAEKLCSTHDEFLELYLADKEVLLERGIAKENIYLVPDMI